MALMTSSADDQKVDIDQITGDDKDSDDDIAIASITAKQAYPNAKAQNRLKRKASFDIIKRERSSSENDASDPSLPTPHTPEPARLELGSGEGQPQSHSPDDVQPVRERMRSLTPPHATPPERIHEDHPSLTVQSDTSDSSYPLAYQTRDTTKESRPGVDRDDSVSVTGVDMPASPNSAEIEQKDVSEQDAVADVAHLIENFAEQMEEGELASLQSTAIKKGESFYIDRARRMMRCMLGG